MIEKGHPRAGVAILLLNNQKVLLGKRVDEPDKRTWGPPWGELEYYKSAKETGLAMLTKRTGLIGANLKLLDERPVAVTEDFFSDDSHHTTLYLRARYVNGNSFVVEPGKNPSWRWYEWGKFPHNLFLPVKNLIKLGYDPFNGIK